ncbi:Tyramine beta hydroxylase [Carabus blaptoides fortunei]
MITLLSLVLVIFKITGGSTDEHKQIFDVALDPLGKIKFYWNPDYTSSTLKVEIHTPNNYSWLAIGFSNYGELFPSDLCVLWTDFKGNVHFDDTRANEEGILQIDKKQDCLQFRKVTTQRLTKFAFNRAFDTCDEDDYIIEDGTVHLVWARGTGPVYQISGLNINTSLPHDRGMARVQLLKNTMDNVVFPPDVNKLDILAHEVKVPKDETTYWCHVHRLPAELKKKHHIVQYEAVIQQGNEGLVHHMEVFHCVAPVNQEIPLYVGPCFAKDRPESTMVCKRVLAAWAMGAAEFKYPNEAGLPLGGPDFNPYVMLEVHYNNPQERSDWVDSSGVQFHITSHLRAMDAGVIELGLEYTDKMAIPPGQEQFSLTGFCVTECTAVSIPKDGITVFGSQLHTHLTGVRVFTRHIRNGIELTEMNRDDHYSTHFQEIRKLKKRVTILPGDALLTTCDYNTVSRDNITLGGFAISDEMCVNYIHYFPATALEVCKSAISDQALSTYFRYMNEWENQKTNTNNGISDNYKAITWTPIRVQFLNKLYHEAPLSMQCNMSSGDRFPGYWENTPVTPVPSPLPPPVRDCKNTATSNDVDQ